MQRFTTLLVLAVLVGACGGSETSGDAPANETTAARNTTEIGEEGEITGVQVEGSMEDNVLQEVVYVGTVIVRLSDGREITAECNEDLFTTSIPDWKFTNDLSGEFVVSVALAVDPPRRARVVQDNTGEWEVVEIGG